MLDPMLEALFRGTVLPAMQAMPSKDLEEIRAFLNVEVDKELARRALEE